MYLPVIISVTTKFFLQRDETYKSVRLTSLLRTSFPLEQHVGFLLFPPWNYVTDGTCYLIFLPTFVLFWWVWLLQHLFSILYWQASSQWSLIELLQHKMLKHCPQKWSESTHSITKTEDFTNSLYLLLLYGTSGAKCLCIPKVSWIQRFRNSKLYLLYILYYPETRFDDIKQTKLQCEPTGYFKPQITFSYG